MYRRPLLQGVIVPVTKRSSPEFYLKNNNIMIEAMRLAWGLDPLRDNHTYITEFICTTTWSNHMYNLFI